MAVPSNPWLAVGWRERDAITFPIRPYLAKKGIDLVAQRVQRIDRQQSLPRDCPSRRADTTLAENKREAENLRSAFGAASSPACNAH